MAALRIFARSKLSTILHISNRSGPLKCASPTVVEIQKRHGNYVASPIYKESNQYTDFETSRDPNEWRYVERCLGYKTIPAPPETTDLPSGWKPATAIAKDYPYFVQRTKNHMQPVYLGISYRGMRRVTKIRKVQGDIWSLAEELRSTLERQAGKRVGVRINELVGLITFKGDHVSRVKEWLDAKGF